MDTIVEEFGFGSDFGFPTSVADADREVEVVDTYRDSIEAGDANGSEVDPWSQLIDHKAEEEAVRATMPPGGWYEVPKLTGTLSAKEADVYLKVDGELRLVKQTRYNARLYGKGYLTDAEGTTHSPLIRFTICPQLAYGKDSEGRGTDKKLAHSYKLYLSAKKAYAKQFNQEPQTPSEVVSYLETHPVKIRTFQATDGLVVLDLEAILT